MWLHSKGPRRRPRLCGRKLGVSMGMFLGSMSHCFLSPESQKKSKNVEELRFDKMEKHWFVKHEQKRPPKPSRGDRGYMKVAIVAPPLQSPPLLIVLLPTGPHAAWVVPGTICALVVGSASPLVPWNPWPLQMNDITFNTTSR